MQKRHNEIILSLLAHPKGLSGNDLSTSLGVTIRTIRSDIKKINLFLKDYNIKIRASKKNGYYFDESSKQLLIKSSLYINRESSPITNNDRTIFLLLLLSFSNHPLPLYYLCESMFASESSLYVTLKNAKEMINNHFPNLQIVQPSTSTFELIGDEDAKRNLISGLLSHNSDRTILKQYSQYIAEKNTIYSTTLELIDIISNVFEAHGYFLSGEGIFSFAIDISITFERFYNNHHINLQSKSIAYTENKCFLDLITILEDFFSNKLDSNEWEYLYKRFISKQFSENTNLSKISSNINVTTLVEDFLNNIFYKYNIDFRNEQSLKNKLILHMTTSINRIKFNYYSENPIKYNIRDNHLFLIIVSSELSSLLFATTGLSMNLSELSYIAIYLLATFEQNKSKTKVLVVCDHCDSIKYLLLNNINSLLNNNILIVDICTSNKLNHYYSIHRDIGLIISSVNISNILKIDLNIPVIQVSPIFTDMEKKLISQTCFFHTNILNESNKINYSYFDKKLFLAIDKNNSIDNIIITFFKMNNIYINDTILKKIRMNLDDSSFNSIYKNTNSILVLPPQTDESFKTKISIIIPNRPLIHNDNKYNILVFVTINKLNNSNLSDLFNTISLIINNNLISKLEYPLSYDDFLNIL